MIYILLVHSSGRSKFTDLSRPWADYPGSLRQVCLSLHICPGFDLYWAIGGEEATAVHTTQSLHTDHKHITNGHWIIYLSYGKLLKPASVSPPVWWGSAAAYVTVGCQSHREGGGRFYGVPLSQKWRTAQYGMKWHWLCMVEQAISGCSLQRILLCTLGICKFSQFCLNDHVHVDMGDLTQVSSNCYWNSRDFNGLTMLFSSPFGDATESQSWDLLKNFLCNFV